MPDPDGPPRLGSALLGLVLAALAGAGWLLVHGWHWVAAWWAGR